MYNALYVRHNLRFDFGSWLRGLLTGLPLFVILLLVVVYTPSHWFIGSLVMLLVYVLLAKVLRLINRSDIDLLRRSVPRRFSRVIDLVEELMT